MKFQKGALKGRIRALDEGGALRKCWGRAQAFSLPSGTLSVRPPRPRGRWALPPLGCRWIRTDSPRATSSPWASSAGRVRPRARRATVRRIRLRRRRVWMPPRSVPRCRPTGPWPSSSRYESSVSDRGLASEGVQGSVATSTRPSLRPSSSRSRRPAPVRSHWSPSVRPPSRSGRACARSRFGDTGKEGSKAGIGREAPVARQCSSPRPQPRPRPRPRPSIRRRLDCDGVGDNVGQGGVLDRPGAGAWATTAAFLVPGRTPSPPSLPRGGDGPPPRQGPSASSAPTPAFAPSPSSSQHICSIALSSVFSPSASLTTCL